MKVVSNLVFAFLFSQTALAGDKIGNGGGLWTCENSLRQMQSAMLVDLFEAQVEFGLKITPIPSATAQQIAVQKSEVLRNVNSVLTDKLGAYLAEVFKKAQFVNAVLEKVDDALYRIEPLPAACPLGQWQYLQFANFTPQNLVIIRNDVWTSPLVSEMDKAGLLVHEAVYRWMREEYLDKNSVRSRQIVGLLFSDLNPAEINQRINAVLANNTEPDPSDLWACKLKNPNANKIFLGSGKSEPEARAKSAQICTEKTSAFFCDRKAAECEMALSNGFAWFCEVTNPNTQKVFSGKGRTSVEASYQAQKTCEETSNGGFFCDHATCSKN